MAKRLGTRTIVFQNRPSIKGFAAVAGKKESQGPLAKYFDKTFEDTTLGQKTWERAEGLLQKEATLLSLKKAGLEIKDIDFIFAGDLLDQCISSMFGLKEMNVPFLGQFGACSTMAQTIILSSIMVESGIAKNAVAVTSSHFCSAERQYRFPLEYGGQRPPSAQWTVTGAGAIVIGESTKVLPYVEKAVVGKIVDLGVNDASNMGAVMAPAASESIKNFLIDTATTPEDYDLILTGDLGEIGSTLLIKLLEKESIKIKNKHKDCGLMIFQKDTQDVHSGGSGCGCSASTLCSIILQRVKNHELKNILFIATGALMSPTSFKQGETIPGIAHLVQIRS
ncbi:MAG: stage V sporulation protein AD [Oscillospiraceae bacterium]|jgi:stage V sporulation protein AD|nr:stage V sporulation protein AD [Oscillospiraceae bacterium]